MYRGTLAFLLCCFVGAAVGGERRAVCEDTIPSCADSGIEACTKYAAWAHDHCAKFCAFCTSTQQCVDKVSDCATYGPDECNKYPAWAQDNCQHTCNLCPIDTQQCVDKISDCAMYGANACNEFQAWAQDNCQHTCNLCPNGGGAGNITQQCVDKISDCAAYGANACNEYQAWAQDNCQHTCNLCPTGHQPGCYYKGQVHAQGTQWDDGCDYNCTCLDGRYRIVPVCPTYTHLPNNCHLEKPANECCSKLVCENVTDTQQCVDKISNCAAYGANACHEFQAWAQDNCQHTCNLCPDGHPPGCVYKGQLHAQGTQWDDGCAYRCTCEDGATGLYRCTDMCPTYIDLPTNCHLEKPANECCSKPVCENVPGDAASTTPPSIANSCVYKGKAYQQGETWVDGCDYACECQDGATGRYHCTSMCYTFDLPATCHYNPPPHGLCCKVPSCPPNVDVQYPPGYVPK